MNTEAIRYEGVEGENVLVNYKRKFVIALRAVEIFRFSFYASLHWLGVWRQMIVLLRVYEFALFTSWNGTMEIRVRGGVQDGEVEPVRRRKVTRMIVWHGVDSKTLILCHKTSK